MPGCIAIYIGTNDGTINLVLGWKVTLSFNIGWGAEWEVEGTELFKL